MDLKTDNILLERKDSLRIKIADFGFATYFDPEYGLETNIGTPQFMAPELLIK